MIDETTNLLDIVHELGPQFADRAPGHDGDDSFVAENFAELKQHRFFSAMVPNELGGSSVSHGEMCQILRELATYCPSTALTLSMHQHLVAAAVFNHRNGKPGRKLLEMVAAREPVLVSTGAKDWLSSNGVVVKDEGGFRVDARKVFASGSAIGDVMVTSAPYQDPDEGWQVLHFPLPFNTPGVRVDNTWRAMGMRGTGSNTVILEDVFVPEEAVVLRRPQSEYHGVWNVVLTVAMPLIMSVYVGIADAATAIVREKTAKRRDDANLPYLLGEMANAHATAELAHADMVATANDLDFEPAVENADRILIRKTIVTNAAEQTVSKAMEALGGPAFLRATGLERLFRDVHAARFHPLSEKKQQLFSGRLALGLDPIAAID